MIFGQVHVQAVEVPFHLVDAGHAVYHANYLVLCDQARARALKEAGYPAPELWADGYALALYENTSRYLKPATYGQSIVILTSTLAAGGTSLRVRQEMFPSAVLPGALAREGFHPNALLLDDKERIHSVDMTLVCVRFSPLRPSRLPARLSEALNLAAAPKLTRA